MLREEPTASCGRQRAFCGEGHKEPPAQWATKSYSYLPEVNIVDMNQDGLISEHELAALNNRFQTMSNDFVAQIVLSSSYGLMQPMVVSLQDYVGFGSRNPHTVLLNVDDNIRWGVKNLANIFNNSVYVSEEYAWHMRWRTAVGKYNGGRAAAEYNGTFDDGLVEQYAEEVMSRLEDYQPILDSKKF